VIFYLSMLTAVFVVLDSFVISVLSGILQFNDCMTRCLGLLVNARVV